MVENFRKEGLAVERSKKAMENLNQRFQVINDRLNSLEKITKGLKKTGKERGIKDE